MTQYYKTVPMSERLPEDIGYYGVTDNKGNIYRDWFDKFEKEFEGDGENVTHWLEPATIPDPSETAIAFAEWVAKSFIWNCYHELWEHRYHKGSERYTMAELYQLFTAQR